MPATYAVNQTIINAAGKVVSTDATVYVSCPYGAEQYHAEGIGGGAHRDLLKPTETPGQWQAYPRYSLPARR